jgi:hypothetical protein
MAELKVGTHLRNADGPEEVIVVRAPAYELDVRCGSLPMNELGGAHGAAPIAAPVGGHPLQIGKRYVHEPSGLELLCVKAGPGALSVDGEPLAFKNAKQLPASD